MREDWGDDTPLEWMWTPQSQGREAGGPASQGEGPGSPQADRSCWWAGAELICMKLLDWALGQQEASSR